MLRNCAVVFTGPGLCDRVIFGFEVEIFLATLSGFAVSEEDTCLETDRLARCKAEV
jgi:hypothetical protein